MPSTKIPARTWVLAVPAACGVILGIWGAWGGRSAPEVQALEGVGAEMGDGGLTRAEGVPVLGADAPFQVAQVPQERPVLVTNDAPPAAQGQAAPAPAFRPMLDTMPTDEAATGLPVEEPVDAPLPESPEQAAPSVATQTAQIEPAPTPVPTPVDPTVAEFARVTLSVLDLADAYAPAIEAAAARGEDGVLRSELAAETRATIAEGYSPGFDAYIALAQTVRTDPVLEAQVAAEMARLRP